MKRRICRGHGFALSALGVGLACAVSAGCYRPSEEFLAAREVRVVEKAKERAERRAAREAEEQAKERAALAEAAEEADAASREAGTGEGDVPSGPGPIAERADGEPTGAQAASGAEGATATSGEPGDGNPGGSEGELDGFSLPPVIDVADGPGPTERDMVDTFAKGPLSEALPVLDNAIRHSPAEADSLMRGAFAGVGNETEKCQEILLFLAVRHQEIAPRLAESAARINPEIRSWMQ